ncbi:prothymosin alpha-like [Capsicum galapagoense]
MGPLRKAKSWPVYFMYGYKFHTSSWGEGKSTYNSGLCVSGVGQDGITSEYYGVLKEIIEFEWPMTSFMNISIEDGPIVCLHDDQDDSEEVDGSIFQAVVNENEHDISEERDEDISNNEEEGDKETSNKEANDEEEETSEEEDFFYSEDSASHFHTQEEDEDEYEED